MTNKEEFIKIVKENVKRDGIDNLLEYLEYESDFFKAPASTRYHGSYAGGLVDHSLNVYYSLIDEMKFIFGNDWQKRYSMETIVIVSLFHDLCKIGRYKKDIRNVKNQETGLWEQKEIYVYDDNYFALGHASYTLCILNKFICLSDIETQAIYWHMGAFDTSQYSDTKQLCDAYKRNTLAFALSRADMVATCICENEYFIPIEIDGD